ncbi:MAG: ABC transporter substrate-binding protein [Betaproteobacteria bacterium]
MKRFTRRAFLKAGAGIAAGAAGADSLLAAQPAAAVLTLKPEPGATLRVLRWKRFVQGDEDQWMANTKLFTRATGVEVRVDNENWEDIRPKAAVAANVGNGPDIILSTNDDSHQYPDSLLDVTDVCEYLGKKYGPWYPSALAYGKSGNRWIAVPLGCGGNCMNYRESHMKAAGFNEFPKDTAGFLKLCQALKKNGTPPGFALGNATGDANGWCHWLLWAFGGRMVDENNKVVINSKETAAALEYVKQLYPTFVQGTLSWLDSNNNKAFLSGDISLTNNGISIYYAAKNSPDPKMKAIAADMQHANFPIGPIGRSTESALFFTSVIFKYTKYPNAAKNYLRFMMEKEQYELWQQAAIGFVAQPLTAYETNPIWTADPKHTPFKLSCKNMLPNGYAGKLGTASAACMADFIVVNMIAEAATGTPTQEAMKKAERRAQRYYR